MGATAIPAGERMSRAPLWRDALGAFLRRERLAQGRILSDVAGEADVSTQYLSEIERGRKEPSSEILGSVADALGLSLLDVAAGVASELGAVPSGARSDASAHAVRRAPVLDLTVARSRAGGSPQGASSGASGAGQPRSILLAA
ncbi:XRE family transcriptional regulator [Agromyces protaetiae]|uniref:XRE family transcriptional regulator n=1 Tax=Agromyces protaetiae TaxID=2509455 RepID=A0A4P6FBH5_9MICO|nr:helix-turn-helix transcriptional regulator [Agromyces protaetiae]QAY72976.1 XRE family transcriptional regulator [Agromyces protaetiae]